VRARQAFDPDRLAERELDLSLAAERSGTPRAARSAR
jgi:hypothetical protein